MKYHLAPKFFAIGLLCLLFLIGLRMVDSLVDERKYYHRDVVDEIKETQVREQQIITPFILKNADLTYTFMPNKSHISAQIKVLEGAYQRGVYQALTYDNSLNVVQRFDLTQPTRVVADTLLPNHNPTNNPTVVIDATASGATPNSVIPSSATPNSATSSPTLMTAVKASYTLIIPISDLRGAKINHVQVAGRNLNTQLGDNPTLISNIGSYMTVELPNNLPSQLDVAINANIAGLETWTVVPLGENFALSATGNWGHLKFYGAGLPQSKTLDPQSFSASWYNDFLAKNNANLLSSAVACHCVDNPNLGALAIDFVSKTAPYAQIERTIKYAIILLVVSFGAFFLFEIITKLRIHSIQYALVAAALLIFYLLLLSISEYAAFWQAYLIASVACVGLIGWYTSYVLKSRKKAVGFGVVLASLYGGFYVILSVSQWNLLLGSLFCFMLVFVAMYVTRHVDWYKVENGNDAP